MKLIFVLFSALLTSCNYFVEESIVGKWKGENSVDGMIVFHKNGKLEVFDNNGIPAIKAEDGVEAKWEVIDQVSPKQLYVNVSVGEKNTRTPHGIFKITDGKLIIREVRTYYNTISGIKMSVSRHEVPKDFSGVIQTYTRIE